MSKISKKAKEKRGKSLFVKYFTYTAAVVGGAMLFIGTALLITIAVQWWNDRVNTMRDNAHQLVASIEEGSFDYSDENYRRDISDYLEVIVSATKSDYFITDTEGKIVICAESGKDLAYRSHCKEHANIAMDEEHMARALNEGFSEYSAHNDLGYGVFLLAVPIKQDGQSVGAVYVTEDAISGLVPYMLSIIETVFIITIVSLGVALLMIYFLSKGVTRPIEEMRQVTTHYAKGEFDFKANENYNEEFLKEFAVSLNKMAQDIARENEAQKNFVANVSHELKTPMTSIGGFIDGIIDGTITPDKQMEYLHLVSNEVKRLTRMIYSMLNLSKIEAGEVKIMPSDVNMSALIFETLLTFEQKIEQKHINVEGFDEMGRVIAYCDKDLITQAVYNLLDNAVKFTQENGTISVFAKSENDELTVSIRNTGKGVSNEEISKIFERFYKVDKSRSYDKKGVGLGLYITKTIIKMHGGDIVASSKEGEYTQFEFTIPNKKPEIIEENKKFN